MSNTENTEKFPLTIDVNLFEAWQIMRRHDDVKELCELTGKSNPIIYRALNYGHVRDSSLEDDISTFYENRAKKQRENAKKILKNLT